MGVVLGLRILDNVRLMDSNSFAVDLIECLWKIVRHRWIQVLVTVLAIPILGGAKVLGLDILLISLLGLADLVSVAFLFLEVFHTLIIKRYK